MFLLMAVDEGRWESNELEKFLFGFGVKHLECYINQSEYIDKIRVIQLLNSVYWRIRDLGKCKEDYSVIGLLYICTWLVLIWRKLLWAYNQAMETYIVHWAGFEGIEKLIFLIRSDAYRKSVPVISEVSSGMAYPCLATLSTCSFASDDGCVAEMTLYPAVLESWWIVNINIPFLYASDVEIGFGKRCRRLGPGEFEIYRTDLKWFVWFHP